MNLLDHIDNCLGKYDSGEFGSFLEACRAIAKREDVKIISSSRQNATFEIRVRDYKSNIVIENTKDYSSFYKPSEILKNVSKTTGIPESTLISKNTKREIVEARQAYMILSVEKTCSSYTQIAALVDRDHSTVNHALKCAHIPSVRKIIDKVQSMETVAMTNV